MEWAKTRARAERWHEEIQLLEEEMRHSLEYCWWRSRWWGSRACVQLVSASHIAEGLSAYAWEQSLVEQDRAIQWAARWSTIRERARAVLNEQLSSIDTCDALPPLVMEISDDEEDDQEDDVDEEG